MSPSQGQIEALEQFNGGPPTKDEQGLLKEFRQTVKDVLETDEQKSDPFLLRWIRARDGNLTKAEEMLRNSLTWRKQNDIDNVLSKNLDPFIVKNYPFYVDLYDKGGRPVVEVHVGGWDLRKAMNAGKEEAFHEYINFFFETVMLKIKGDKEKGNDEWPITQFTFLLDWEGYSYAQLIHWKAVQGLLRFASQYEAHYPEVVNKVYFINCPSIMPLFMALVRPIIAQKTYEKIITVPSKREEWVPIIRSLTDQPDKLSIRFGGQRETT